jgi:hypothetical protein
MRRPLALTLAVLAAAACRSPEDPAQRYRRFALAARAGDAAAVWAMLSTDSRTQLEARGKALQGDRPVPGVDLRAEALVLGDLSLTSPRVKSATVVRQSAEQAVVAVEDEAGGRGEVTLVKEGREWRVVLPGG